MDARVPEDNDDAPGNGANFRRRLSVSASNQGLAAFGVAPECGTAYLLDREIARIVGEGQAGPFVPWCAPGTRWLLDDTWSLRQAMPIPRSYWNGSGSRRIISTG